MTLHILLARVEIKEERQKIPSILIEELKQRNNVLCCLILRTWKKKVFVTKNVCNYSTSSTLCPALLCQFWVFLFPLACFRLITLKFPLLTSRRSLFWSDDNIPSLLSLSLSLSLSLLLSPLSKKGKYMRLLFIEL